MDCEPPLSATKRILATEKRLGPRGEIKSKPESGYRVYVSNLHHKVTQDDIVVSQERYGFSKRYNSLANVCFSFSGTLWWCGISLKSFSPATRYCRSRLCSAWRCLASRWRLPQSAIRWASNALQYGRRFWTQTWNSSSCNEAKVYKMILFFSHSSLTFLFLLNQDSFRRQQGPHRTRHRNYSQGAV